MHLSNTLPMSTHKKGSFGFHAKIRCNFPNISYLSETQKNNFQFL